MLYLYCIDCKTITEAQKLISPIPAPAPQCPTLPPPLNGGVSASGGTATYTCSTGYTLSGSSTRTCQTNGAWSGAAPTCSATAGQCPELSHPSGGTVRLINPQSPGSGYAIYSCNTGNIRIGSSFRICQTDGTWNGNAPTCQGECDIGLVADHMIFPVATCVWYRCHTRMWCNISQASLKTWSTTHHRWTCIPFIVYCISHVVICGIKLAMTTKERGNNESHYNCCYKSVITSHPRAVQVLPSGLRHSCSSVLAVQPSRMSITYTCCRSCLQYSYKLWYKLNVVLSQSNLCCTM